MTPWEAWKQKRDKGEVGARRAEAGLRNMVVHPQKQERLYRLYATGPGRQVVCWELIASVFPVQWAVTS